MEDFNAFLGRDVVKYSSLCAENESVTEKYKLIWEIEEASKELLSLKKKNKNKQISPDSRVINARKVYCVYIENQTERNQEKLQRCKSFIQKADGTI